MVNNHSDIAKLVRLMVKKTLNQKRIVIGMGGKGKITRIIGPLMGNYLTYASTEFGQSAPGQIEIRKLKEIYNL